MITAATVLGFLIAAAGGSFPASALLPADTVEIKEWKVPWDRTRPRDPIVDAEGRIWFVGQVGNYVASLDPSTGQFRRIDLPARALPHNVIVGPDGYLWYAGNGDSHIGRIDPKSGAIRRFDMPDPSARDPHTLIFAPNGDLWFTVQGGNFIGRLNPKSGDVKLVKPSVDRSRPYGIVVDETGRPWVVLFGTNRVATVDPASMRVKEYTLPNADARPRRIARTRDGTIWYVDYARGTLGRLDPKSGQATEFKTPGGASSRPYALTVDDRDRLWFVETGSDANQMVGFDPKTREFFSVKPIPSGGGSVRHMVFHAPTRSIWFGTDANTIGRAQVP